MFAELAITLLRSTIATSRVFLALHECLAHRTWMRFWRLVYIAVVTTLCSWSSCTSELELSPCVCNTGIITSTLSQLACLLSYTLSSLSGDLCWHVFCAVLLIDILNSTKVAWADLAVKFSCSVVIGFQQTNPSHAELCSILDFYCTLSVVHFRAFICICNASLATFFLLVVIELYTNNSLRCIACRCGSAMYEVGVWLERTKKSRKKSKNKSTTEASGPSSTVWAACLAEASSAIPSSLQKCFSLFDSI